MFPTILTGVGLLSLQVLVSATGQPTFQRPLSNSNNLDYFSYPQLHWKSKLEGATLEDGNSVEHSPFDDGFIYITTKEANLMVLSASNGTLLTTISPSSSTTNGNSTNIDPTTYCESGMAFGTLKDGSPFVIYAVVEEPRSDEFDIGPQTRVVAVSIPDHKELWSSKPVKGQNSGSPVLFKSEDQETYVALTHNSELQTVNNTVMTTGYLTVLRAEDGKTIWTESESSWNKQPLGYSPPQVAYNPSVRKYDTQVDMVLWASKGEEGTGSNGNLYAFQLPADFDPEQIEQQPDLLNLTSIVLKQVRWTTTLSPVFGNGGQSMFFGVTGDQLRGWVNNTPFDATATWTLNLKSPTTNDLAAIPVNPTLSKDGERLFVSTSSGEGFCIDAKSSNVTWEFSGSSRFLAAHVSQDDKRVYFIQAIDGRVFAYDQGNGALQWVTSCDAFEDDCSNSVLASFTLSRNGQYLVYSDVLGTIFSLKLGESVSLPAETGSSGPADDSTIPPRPLSMTVAPVSTDTSNGIPMSASIALIFLSIFVAITSAVSFVLIRQARLRARRKVDNASQGSMKEEDEDDGNVDGMDQYEDSMIANQSPDSLPITPKRSTSWTEDVRDLPNLSEPTNSMDKGSTATISPRVPDDYSLGASLLL